MRWQEWLLAGGLAFFIGCGASNRTVIYGDHNYKSLPAARDVTVKFTDGNIVRFHHMEVVGVDDRFIYARCWLRENSEPKELKFVKNEVIIEDTEFNTSNTFGYIASFAITLGILYLLQRLIYD